MSPRDRRQVVDADRRQLAVAAHAPVQVLLQLHDGDEASLVDRRQRHHGAGDVRAVAIRVLDGRIDGDLNVGRLDRIFRQAALDAERAPQRPRQAADVEQVGPVGQQIEPHRLLLAGRLERRFRFVAAEAAGLHVLLPERVLDQRAALRAPREQHLDHVLHVAADLVERFAERLGRVLFAQQAG